MEANCGFLHRLDVPCSGLVPWAFQSHEDEGMVCVVVVREISIWGVSSVRYNAGIYCRYMYFFNLIY